ncbi:MAG: glycosyltransferase [Candidatus Acidiferrales bacterium]
MRPTASILIDTFNHERFIEQAIVSVLEQDALSPDDEILVVDDGSIDGTPQIVQRFAPRVRLLQKTNGGQASAFNAGIPELTGEIVALLDGDDWWTRDKLGIVLEKFAKNPEVGMVGHGCQITDQEGNVTRVVQPDRTYRLDLRSTESARLFDRLKGFFGTSRVAYRRSVLERILPLPEELVFEADEYLWSVGAALADFIALDQSLFYYRMHDSNFFMDSQDSDAAAARRYRVMACLWRELPPRLASLGVSPEIADAALLSLKLEVDMLRLRVEGGWSWEMFRAERAAAHYSYSGASLGYRAFKAFSLALSLVLPPKTFCRLKRWYSASDLRRYRSVLGEPTAAGQTAERRAAT